MSGQRCPVCGFENPAGSSFCENCGNQLPDPEATVPADGRPAVPVRGPTAPQPLGPNPWAPPPQYPAAGASPGFPTPPAQPAPAPGAYPAPAGPAPGQPSPPPQAFSPYYHPAGPPPPVSRTSPGLIVGVAALALVALVVLSLAGFLLVRHLTSAPTANRGPAPVATPRGGPVPSPTTAPTTAPTAPPTSPPQGGGAGGTVTTHTFSLDPSGFEVTKQTDVLVNLEGSVGFIAVTAGQPDLPTTTSQELSRIQQQLESQYGALETCVEPQAYSVGGKPGTLEGWRYLDTDSSGNEVQVCDAYWVNAASSGNLYEYEQLGDDRTFNSRLEPAAAPVRQSIQWRV